MVHTSVGNSGSYVSDVGNSYTSPFTQKGILGNYPTLVCQLYNGSSRSCHNYTHKFDHDYAMMTYLPPFCLYM